MGVNCLIMQEGALSVETYHLATGAETRIDCKYIFFSERWCKKQLAQIIGKHSNGLIISLFFWIIPEFCLHRRRKKPFPSVFYSIQNYFWRSIIAFYKNITALDLILLALEKQTYSDFEIIVAEDDNDPKTIEFIGQIT